MTTNNTADDDRAMASLFRLRTADISDRLKAMLETERRPQYRRRDYLQQQQQHCHRRQGRHGHGSSPPQPPSSQRASFSRSSSRSRASKVRRHDPRDDTSSAICPASRAKIVQWLYECVDYLELSRECVAMAMGYVDRFMSLPSSDSRGCSDDHRKIVGGALRDASLYQLFSVAALFLAAKQNDSSLPRDLAADALAGLSRDSYSAEEIVDAEAVLLDALGWRLCDVTTAAVARHAVALLSKSVERRPRHARADDRRRLASVLDFATLQIELAVADYASAVLRRPSAVALAAVLNSVELLDFTEQETRRFGRALRDVDGGAGGLDARSGGVGAAREELHRAFDRRSRAVATRSAAGRAVTPSPSPGGGARQSHSPIRSRASPVDVLGRTDATGRSRRTKKEKKQQRGRKQQHPNWRGVD